MGYMRHNTIIISSCLDGWIDKAHKKACKIFPVVSESLMSNTNGYESFFIPPDGSNKGWAADKVGDVQREEYIKWLNAQKYEDGSSPLEWVEVQYADENKVTKIVNHSDL